MGKAILLGEKGTIIFDVENRVSRTAGWFELELNGGKRVEVPRNMLVMAYGLEREEVNDLAKQLGGDNPIFHFTPKAEMKDDLNQMLNEEKEEKTDDKTLSINSNIF